jgi:hypothetical protein
MGLHQDETWSISGESLNHLGKGRVGTKYSARKTSDLLKVKPRVIA